CFLAHGHDVHATDPAPDAEQRLRERVAQCMPALARMGVASAGSPGQLTFHSDVESAAQGCHVIQENGPERLEIKRETIKRISTAAPADALIATSSSGIPVSDVQDIARHPERVLLGHPFNPPHLIPLVEVVAGRLTSQEAIDRAMAFYSSLGKK